MPEVHALVLAAGASTRLGRPKQLLAWQGRSLLAAVVEPLLAAGLTRVVVVLGSEAGRIGREAGLPDDPRLARVAAPDWNEGIAASLRAGVAACAGADALLVALGDQPGVAPELVREIVARAGSAPLVVPLDRGRGRHPILFGRELFAELLALRGDRGAREVVRRHWSEAAFVPAGPLADVDLPADYEALLRGEPRSAEGIPGPEAE